LYTEQWRRKANFSLRSSCSDSWLRTACFPLVILEGEEEFQSSKLKLAFEKKPLKNLVQCPAPS